jgi:uncharacterized surface protein with fasciclin (FAS1) repeats
MAAAVVMVSALTAAACDSTTAPDPLVDIVTTAQAAGQFNTLLTAVEAAGLTATLQSGGPFTVFAPTDAAFAEIPPATLQALLADTEALTAVLTYHVVPGEVPASQVVGLSSAPTVNGKALPITVVNGEVFVDGVRVLVTDVRASNGIIHVIEGVLLP